MTNVTSVERAASNWKVKISTGSTLNFDLVFVCNGHYRVPRYPNTPGIAEWLKSGKASHSAWYRHPHDLGDTILVIGAGPSGQDISKEMCTVARTVIQSVTGATREDIGNLKRRGRVSHFELDGQVTFEDGTKESDISHCILATGYDLSFPFLSNSLICSDLPPPAPPLPAKLHNSTYNVFPLAKHIFPLQTLFPPTSLVFLGLLTKVAPFPLVEAQARAALYAFINPAALNAPQEAVAIITRYEELRLEVGDNQLSISKAWHRFKPLEQFDYRDDLYEFIGSGLNVALSSQEGLHVKVPEWVKKFYCKKDILRKGWVILEEIGEADKWIRGVGENGPDEWVELMDRILKWMEERNILVEELDKSKL